VMLYWAMGLAGALGLFASVVCHELAHALVARRYGAAVHRITLFLFGGVAELEDEPTRPAIELLTAIVGPLLSLLLALACFGVSLVGWRAAWPAAIAGVISYLGAINGALAIFNLVPAFPLDGGRALRALLWRWKGDRLWATRLTTQLGSAFGVFLIVLGGVSVFAGDLLGGIWWVVLGVFLRSAARMSYQHMLFQHVLAHTPVRRLAVAHPITVPPSISVAELVDAYVYPYHQAFFPVVDDGRVIGCVSTRQVKQLPRAAWSQQRVGAIAEPCSPHNTVSPDMDAAQLLATMQRTGASRWLVVDGDHLVGLITLNDLLHFVALKLELDRQTT